MKSTQENCYGRMSKERRHFSSSRVNNYPGGMDSRDFSPSAGVYVNRITLSSSRRGMMKARKKERARVVRGRRSHKMSKDENVVDLGT